MFVLVTGVLCFFVLDRKFFWGIVIGEAIALLVFATTLLSYYVLKRRKPAAGNASNIRFIRFILAIFLGKLTFIGIVFYILSKFDFLSFLSLLISFLVFFTIFFNLVIFLIYKKILFR